MLTSSTNPKHAGGALRLRRRSLVIGGAATAAVLGVVAGLAVGLNERDGSDGSVAAGRATGFWSLLEVPGSDFFVPQNLRELAEPADLVILGRIVGVESEGPSTSAGGEINGLDRVFLIVEPSTIFDGAPESTKMVKVQLFKPSLSSIEEIRASLPRDAQLFVLYNVGDDIARAGGSDAQVSQFTDVWAPLSSRGIIAISATGDLVAPRDDNRPVAALVQGAKTLQEAGRVITEQRQLCNRTASCLRDVFNPNGPSTGPLEP